MSGTDKLRSRRPINGLLVFMLLALLAVFCLMSVVMGAGVYDRTVSDRELNSQLRTTVSYIAARIRSCDEQGCVRVENIAGCEVLVLSETYSQTNYNTYIYWRDGAVYEYFADSSMEFDPSFGAETVSCKSLEMSQKGSLITIAAEADGSPAQLSVRLNSTQKEGDR